MGYVERPLEILANDIKQLIDKAKSASKDPNQITFDRIKPQKWCVKGDWPTNDKVSLEQKDLMMERKVTQKEDAAAVGYLMHRSEGDT